MNTNKKYIIAAIAAVGVGLLCWAKFRDASDYESASQRTTRWRKEAEASARSACSNELGFYRIVNVSADTFDDQPGKWTASATVEVIKGASGVERKNVQMRARFASGRIWFERLER